jgi:acyl carrier protein
VDKQFAAGMAEIFEVDESEMTDGYALSADNWNSLAIVSTIALGDELYGVVLNGQGLSKCKTLGDVAAMIAKAKGSV